MKKRGSASKINPDIQRHIQHLEAKRVAKIKPVGLKADS